MTSTSQEQFEEIARLCITKWGTLAQVDMVVEELSELIDAAAKTIKAIQKTKRVMNQGTMESLLEEGVDAEVMLGELKIILSLMEPFKSKPDFWEEMREYKIQRLRERLSTH